METLALPNTTPVRSFHVPYVALSLQAQRVKGQLMDAIERVLGDGMYITGPDMWNFESRFAEYCGTGFAVGVSNGTDALILALRALGVGRGDDVITAPNSFAASASCAALLGATPTFVDVLKPDMNMDPDLLERGITPQTRAIIPVHLAGYPADMDPILEIAGRHDIPVIEDAAQAVGAIYHGRRTGSMGLMGCFSFHPLKNLHAYGDGGMITTNDETIYNWLIKARSHGFSDRDHIDFWSTNSRLDTLQAAVLNVKLDYLDQWIEERRAIAQEYRNALSDFVLVPEEAPGRFHTYQTFMIAAENRSQLLEHLEKRGVEPKIHYPIPIHMQQAAQSLGYQADDYPVTKWLSDRIVSLPLYAELSPEQRTMVIDGVRSFYLK